MAETVAFSKPISLDLLNEAFMRSLLLAITKQESNGKSSMISLGQSISKQGQHPQTHVQS
jgi:hypothetical protein